MTRRIALVRIRNVSITEADDIDVLNYTCEQQAEEIKRLNAKITENENFIDALTELVLEGNWKEIRGLLGVDNFAELYTDKIIPELA
jgi:hypothetical protein